MQDLINTIVSILRGVLRFRWAALGVASVMSIMSAAAVSQLPDKYDGSARVFVDSNRVLQPLLKGLTVNPDVNQRVRMMTSTLLSRPNLEKLVRMTDIGIHATTDYEKEVQINELERGIRLNGVRNNPSLYTIAYTHEDPETARRMVQAIITVFVESTLGDKREDSESAQEFLGQQIRLYEGRLAQAESRLSQFQRDNVGKMPNEAGGYYQRLNTKTDQLREARLQLGEVDNRIVSLRERLSTEPRTMSAGLADSLGISPVQQQIAQQRQELSALLLRYTDRHPRVAQLRASIADLEAERTQDDGVRSVSTTPRIANPVYQEVIKLLAEAEAEQAGLQVRVEAFQIQVDELNDTVDSIPKVEQQLAQLNRDYAVVKDQYLELLSRQESARLSEDVEQNVDDVKFRVIDPPFVPSRPSSPNKPLFTFAGFLAAVGAGLAAAFALSLLRPVFYDSSSIASKTGRPILGSVSYSKSLTRRQILLNAAFLSMCALLGLFLIVVLAIQFGIIGMHHFESLAQTSLGGGVIGVIKNFMSLVGSTVTAITGG